MLQKDLCFDTTLALLRLINSQAMIYHYLIRPRDLEDDTLLLCLSCHVVSSVCFISTVQRTAWYTVTRATWKRRRGAKVKRENNLQGGRSLSAGTSLKSPAANAVTGPRFFKRGPRASLGATERLSGGHKQRPSLALPWHCITKCHDISDRSATVEV